MDVVFLTRINWWAHMIVIAKAPFAPQCNVLAVPHSRLARDCHGLARVMFHHLLVLQAGAWVVT